MKRLIFALLSLLCTPHLQAQNVEGQIIAAQYGEYKVPGQSTGGFTFPSDTCQVTGGGKNFSAFATGVAVKIVDANPAQTEIATPSSVFITQCTINMSTANQHVPPYYLTSGTGGLQEAITANQQGIAGANSIILNSEWYALIKPRSAATVIGSVQGNTQMPLVDVTTTPYTWYQWNGSAYALVTIGGGTQCLGTSEWNSANPYIVSQFACQGGILYTATANSTNQQPSPVSAFWTPTFFAGGAIGGGVILGGQFFSGGSFSAEGAPVPAFVSASGNFLDYEQQQGTDIFQWGAQNNGTTQNYWSIFLNNTAGTTANPHNFTVNFASNGIGHDEWHQANDNFLCWATGDSATGCAHGLSLDADGATIDLGSSKGDHSGSIHLNNITIDGACSGCGGSSVSYTAGTGGVTAHTLVMGDGAGNVIPFVSTSTNYGLYSGIALSTAVAIASTTVASSSGQLVACQFDGTPVVGDAVIGSTGTPGDCHDNGSPNLNIVGARVPVVGWVQSVSGTVGTVRLAGLGLFGNGNIIVNNTTSGQTLVGALTMEGMNSTKVGNIFYVDGYNTSNFPGIGVAQTAWSAGNYNQCTAVSVSAGSITAWSIANTAASTAPAPATPAFSTATFTMTNSLVAGQYVTLSGFGTSTFFNGMSGQVISTGLSSSQFEIVLPSAQSTTSGTEAGVASLNYLSVARTTSATPGGSSNLWYPVPNGSTPTQLDCAWYSAAGSIVTGTGTVESSGIGASLVLGEGTYTTNIGLLEPTVTSSQYPVINIFGQGRNSASIIQQGTAKNDGLATLQQPATLTAFAFATFDWEKFTVNGNFVAPAVINIYGASGYIIKDVLAENAKDGSDHYIEFGQAADTSHYWNFEQNIDNLNLGRSVGFGSGAVVTATVSGGVPSFTIVAGGSNYGTGTDVQVILAGTSDFGRPCSSIGTTTGTFASGVLTGVTSSATGCVAPLYVIVFSGANIAYGYKFSNVSDRGHINSLTDGGVGSVAGLYLSNAVNAITIDNYHPISTLRGVQNYGGVTFNSLQCDTIFQYCFDQEGLGGTINLNNPFYEWNNNNMTASRDLFFAPTSGVVGFNLPMAFNITGEVCGNRAQQLGYIHFDSGAGAIDTKTGSDSASMPLYVNDSNPQYCNTSFVNPAVPQANLVGQTVSMGNGVSGNQWNFGMGTAFLDTGNQTMTVTQANSTTTSLLGAYTWNWSNTNPATSGQNYKSPIQELSGAYWDGSVTQPYGINQELTFASGSGPLATYAFTHTGTIPAGGMVYSFDNPVQVPAEKSGTASNRDLVGVKALVGGTTTFTFLNTYATAPVCTTQDRTTPANASNASTTTTVLTLNGTGTDSIGWICVGLN